jgi:hypothetical protein
VQHPSQQRVQAVMLAAARSSHLCRCREWRAGWSRWLARQRWGRKAMVLVLALLLHLCRCCQRVPQALRHQCSCYQKQHASLCRCRRGRCRCQSCGAVRAAQTERRGPGVVRS